MKSIKICLAMAALLSFVACNTQIKNATTQNVRIYGNCGMCKSTIEKAGNIKKVVQVDWNKDTKMATLTYDSLKTNPDVILKRITLAGYDNDQFLAPDDVFAKLPKCCQYVRVNKKEMAKVEVMEDPSKHNHSAITDKKTEVKQVVKQDVNHFNPVFESYFALKDALVKSDGNLASAKAKELIHAINMVEMNKLTHEEHIVWMQVMKDLKFDAEHIEETKDIGRQRDHFSSLSDNMYQLLKIAKLKSPVYYQHCPMAKNGKGANWLSKENAIKNPYFGSQMLTCGKTVESID